MFGCVAACRDTRDGGRSARADVALRESVAGRCVDARGGLDGEWWGGALRAIRKTLLSLDLRHLRGSRRRVGCSGYRAWEPERAAAIPAAGNIRRACARCQLEMPKK